MTRGGGRWTSLGPSFFSLLLIFGVLFCCASGFSQSRRTAIALVTGGADRELYARLQAELRALGWRVVEVQPGSDLALAQIARRARTLAVLRVGQAAEGIEVWVAPEVDAEAKSEWVDVDVKRPELAVVLAVEALRARFLEFGLEPEHSSSSQKALAPAAPRLPAQRPASASLRTVPVSTEANGPSLWLEVGAAAVAAGPSVTPAAELTIRLLPIRWLGFDLAGWWPLSTSRVDATGGSAEVRPALALGSGELRWDVGGTTLGAGAGLGVAHVQMEGHPTDGYLGRKDSVLTGLPFGKLAFEVPFSRGFRLRMTTNLGASTPRAVVRFDERVVASWGRPFLAVTLGAQGHLLGDLL